MFQTLVFKGVEVECFVVDLTEDPQTLLPIIADLPGTELYAQALDTAIRNKIVKEPGKYAIHITDAGQNYNIFLVD